MKKKAKIAAIVVSILFVLIMVAGFVAGNYFYNLALTPGTNREVVFSSPHNTMGKTVTEEQKQQREAWFIAANPQLEYTQSYDNLKLHATAIANPAAGHRWVIACHGYTSNGQQMKGTAMQFYALGYNVLLPDARGCGESEGSYYGMGWDDRLDVLQWAGTIIEKDPKAEIVLYGVSMGGATVMMVSGEKLPSNIKAIVEDCGYSSIWDEFAYQAKEIFGLPSFPILNFASAVTKIRAGYWLGQGSAVKQVAKSTTPILFIHGDEDTFVPFFMLNEVYSAANCEKEKLVAPGAGHGMASTTLGEVYWNTVENFLNKYVTAN